MTILKIKQPIQRMKFVIKELKAILYLPDELQERGYRPRRGAKFKPERNLAFIELSSRVHEQGLITVCLNMGGGKDINTGVELLGENLMLEKKYTPESEFDVYSEICPIWNGCFYYNYQTYGNCVTVRYLEFYKDKIWVMFCLSAFYDTIEECVSALKHIIDNAEIEIKD